MEVSTDPMESSMDLEILKSRRPMEVSTEPMESSTDPEISKSPDPWDRWKLPWDI